jgi:uncharacterized membrane protein
MSTFPIALSLWLHTLATIVMVGYYAFTGLIYLPVCEQRMKADALRELLEQASRRLRPYFAGSLLIFLLTGTYLMLTNRDYLGLGHFFDNPWSALIVIKHVLVLAFLAVAIYAERAFMSRISDENPKALGNFRLSLNVNLALGAVIILMTSLAQAG